MKMSMVQRAVLVGVLAGIGLGVSTSVKAVSFGELFQQVAGQLTSTAGDLQPGIPDGAVLPQAEFPLENSGGTVMPESGVPSGQDVKTPTIDVPSEEDPHPADASQPGRAGDARRETEETPIGLAIPWVPKWLPLLQQEIPLPGGTPARDTLSVDTPRPVDTTRPTEIVAPIETRTPADIIVPIEVRNPARIGAPIKVQTPARIETPIEVRNPARIETPPEMRSPTQSPAPIETRIPTESMVPIEMRAPAQPEGPIETRGPTEVAAPIETRTPREAVVPMPPRKMLPQDISPDAFVPREPVVREPLPETADVNEPVPMRQTLPITPVIPRQASRIELPRSPSSRPLPPRTGSTSSKRDGDVTAGTDEENPQPGCEEDTIASCSVIYGSTSCAGKKICKNGGWSVCIAPPPVAEACDGVDNDCDGASDEGFNVGEVCTNSGNMQCYAQGILQCAPNGEVTCNTAPVMDGTRCEDGDICTTDDTCQNGVCQPGVISSSPSCEEKKGPLCAPGTTVACKTGLPGLCAEGSQMCREDGLGWTACEPNSMGKTFYMDADGDTYGDPISTIVACEKPQGYVEENTDCNDGNPLMRPGAKEVCDTIDNNCVGGADEPFKNAVGQYVGPDAMAICFAGPAKSACEVQGDYQCAPDGLSTICTAKPNLAAASVEICGNAFDEDCDGMDAAKNACGGCSELDHAISELCGCNAAGTYQCQSDGTLACIGGEPREEVCDGKDNNCNGAIDEGIAVIIDYHSPMETAGIGPCQVGKTECLNGQLITTAPLLPTGEVCDTIDNNCNGEVDEGLLQACYDGPQETVGVGACRAGKRLCIAGNFAQAGCDAQVLPGEELCDDQVDNDCDGATDEGCGGENTGDETRPEEETAEEAGEEPHGDETETEASLHHKGATAPDEREPAPAPVPQPMAPAQCASDIFDCKGHGLYFAEARGYLGSFRSGDDSALLFFTQDIAGSHAYAVPVKAMVEGTVTQPIPCEMPKLAYQLVQRFGHDTLVAATTDARYYLLDLQKPLQLHNGQWTCTIGTSALTTLPAVCAGDLSYRALVSDSDFNGDSALDLVTLSECVTAAKDAADGVATHLFSVDLLLSSPQGFQVTQFPAVTAMATNEKTFSMASLMATHVTSGASADLLIAIPKKTGGDALSAPSASMAPYSCPLSLAASTPSLGACVSIEGTMTSATMMPLEVWGAGKTSTNVTTLFGATDGVAKGSAGQGGPLASDKQQPALTWFGMSGELCTFSVQDAQAMTCQSIAEIDTASVVTIGFFEMKENGIFTQNIALGTSEGIRLGYVGQTSVVLYAKTVERLAVTESATGLDAVATGASFLPGSLLAGDFDAHGGEDLVAAFQVLNAAQGDDGVAVVLWKNLPETPKNVLQVASMIDESDTAPGEWRLTLTADDLTDDLLTHTWKAEDEAGHALSHLLAISEDGLLAIFKRPESATSFKLEFIPSALAADDIVGDLTIWAVSCDANACVDSNKVVITWEGEVLASGAVDGGNAQTPLEGVAPAGVSPLTIDGVDATTLEVGENETADTAVTMPKAVNGIDAWGVSSGACTLIPRP
ncbi:MAG: hypothetical protein HYV02_06065 [Deltaproteobacteria bacterium]|nr:hypothetical protein [Deltaproteobacteria bacterium]